MKTTARWYSGRIQRDIQLVRWGTFGLPVLLFSTAGGDAEECERFLMIRALAPLIDGGKIKVYATDSVAGAAWLSRQHDVRYCSWLQNAFDSFVYQEVVPAIRTDCRSPEIEVITAGASIGAFSAIAALCRHPDVFCRAVALSGTYDLSRWLDGQWNEDFYFSSPIHFLPGLGEGPHLARLRQRFALLATGEGQWEEPGESWKMAHALGAKGIPNRVDLWGPDYDHDWVTWRAMLPRYLGDLAG